MNTRIRVTIGLSLLFTTLVTIGIVSFTSFSNFNRSSEQLYSSMRQESFYLARFIDHLNWDKNLNNLLFTGQNTDIQEDPHKCNLGKWYYPYIQSGDFKALPADAQKAILELRVPHENMHQTVIAIKRFLREGKINDAKKIYYAETAAHLDRVRNVIETINRKSQAMTKDNRLATKARADNSALLITAAFLIGAIIFGAVMYMTYRSLGILNMLRPFNEQFARAALGDLTVRYPIQKVNCSSIMQCGKTSCPDYGKDGVLCWFDVGSFAPNFGKDIHCPKILNKIYKSCHECAVYKQVNTNEVTTLAAWYNKFIENLHDLISGIRSSMFGLNVVVQQISSDNENLSQRTSQQATSLEEIASTIEEATATINQNSEHSKEANDKSEEASRVVQDAKELSTRSISLAESGGEISGRAVIAINEVNKSSKKIAEILKVINDIAFQTNLLALNAAVEAARAGDQGRGFAVVAGEVRNLAQRSAAAANEISEIISDSMNKVEQGTELVTKSGDALTGIIDSAKRSGEALDAVIASVGMVSQLVSEIAAASQEQKQGINQINSAIAEIDSTTQQNASLVEETASASEEMANQAQYLLGMIDKFKINDDTSGKESGNERSMARQMAPRSPAAEVTTPQPAPGNGNGRNGKAGIAISAERALEAEKIRNLMMRQGFNEF